MMGISKNRRQQMIAGWLKRDHVASQEQLVDRLAAAGFVVTQATVSRDLDDLGATKRRRGGALYYALPETDDPATAAARLDRILSEWVIDILETQAGVLIKCPSGSAPIISTAIDRASLEGVGGTIAGDDTVLVVLLPDTDTGSMTAALRTRAAGQESE